MTSVSQKEFLNKLLGVVKKLAVIANTQGSRFGKLWDDNLKTLNDKPHLVRQISLDKSKFIKEIEYRIEVLKNVEQSFVDGFYSIRIKSFVFYFERLLICVLEHPQNIIEQIPKLIAAIKIINSFKFS